MPEPFKTLFNAGLIQQMAPHLARTGPFDTTAFLDTALTGLEDLEMMARSDQITRALQAALPQPFESAVEQVVAALHPRTEWPLADMRTDDTGIAGWAVAPMAEWVARAGLHSPARALAALRQMTMRFSAEFAIRPFFRDHPEGTLRTVTGWLADPNPHVRRLISEGSRPRLPWGIRLNGFAQDPAPLLPLLTALRDDPSDYVRTSVANNLNDIAKDHPDLVASVARDWLQDAPQARARLVKKACRTLIKQGHPATLAVFGLRPPQLGGVRFTATPETIHQGQTLTLSLDLVGGQAAQRLVIDYVMHFRRANGLLSPKVFKWCETTVAPGETVTLTKAHAWRAVTTRRDYPGAQAVEVQINGAALGRVPINLVL